MTLNAKCCYASPHFYCYADIPLMLSVVKLTVDMWRVMAPLLLQVMTKTSFMAN